jgi:hypothetical protein
MWVIQAIVIRPQVHPQMWVLGSHPGRHWLASSTPDSSASLLCGSPLLPILLFFSPNYSCVSSCLYRALFTFACQCILIGLLWSMSLKCHWNFCSAFHLCLSLYFDWFVVVNVIGMSLEFLRSWFSTGWWTCNSLERCSAVNVAMLRLVLQLEPTRECNDRWLRDVPFGCVR